MLPPKFPLNIEKNTSWEKNDFTCRKKTPRPSTSQEAIGFQTPNVFGGMTGHQKNIPSKHLSPSAGTTGRVGAAFVVWLFRVQKSLGQPNFPDRSWSFDFHAMVQYSTSNPRKPSLPSLKLTWLRAWKWMAGRLVLFWDALFSGDVLVLGRVRLKRRHPIKTTSQNSLATHHFCGERLWLFDVLGTCQLSSLILSRNINCLPKFRMPRESESCPVQLQP